MRVAWRQAFRRAEQTHSLPVQSREASRHRSCPALKLLCMAVVCHTVAGTAVAQLPTARLTAIFPPGAQQGTSVELETAGADLDGATTLLFDHAGITAVPKTHVPEGATEPQPVANQFVVTVAADVPVGVYELRAAGTYGVSNPRLFYVGGESQIAETEPNNTPQQATESQVGQVVVGRSGGTNDIDCFRFPATAGQRLLIDCMAQQLDSRMDATLELADQSGRVLALARDDRSRDPLIDLVIPADGAYIVRLYDFTYGGGAEHVYRLSVSVAPHIDFILPAAGTPGTTGSFTLYGRNLPGGSPSEQVTSEGRPLEQLSVEIELPAEEAAWHGGVRGQSVRPAEAGVDAIDYRLRGEHFTSNPIRIARAVAPPLVEQEPNDSLEQALELTAPATVTGQFATVDDFDCYRFSATKGTVLRLEIVSERLGLPTDPAMLVQRIVEKEGATSFVDLQDADDDGTNIGGAHFNTAHHDPVYRFEAPEDGNYLLRVRDLYAAARGGAELVYVLTIRPEMPDFRLVAIPEFPNQGRAAPNPWTGFLRRGGTTRFDCLLFRRDGFSGDVEITVEGLPEGVSTGGCVVGAGQTAARLIIAATEDAPESSGAIRIVGRARIGDADVEHAARGATVVYNATPPAVRLVRNVMLSVGQIAPLGITAGADRVELAQSSRLDIPLTIARREGFTAAFTLTAAPDQLPGKVGNENVNVAENATDATLHLYFQQDAPPGTYTLFAQATAKVPSPRKDNDGNPQQIDVVEVSTPVTVTVQPGPLVLAPSVPDNGAIKRAAEIKVPVKINRRNEFAGPVTLSLMLPAGVTGVAAEEVTVAADQDTGELVIRAAEDAATGNHAHVAIRARVDWNERTVEVHQPIPLNVQE